MQGKPHKCNQEGRICNPSQGQQIHRFIERIGYGSDIFVFVIETENTADPLAVEPAYKVRDHFRCAAGRGVSIGNLHKPGNVDTGFFLRFPAGNAFRGFTVTDHTGNGFKHPRAGVSCRQRANPELLDEEDPVFDGIVWKTGCRVSTFEDFTGEFTTPSTGKKPVFKVIFIDPEISLKNGFMLEQFDIISGKALRHDSFRIGLLRA